jgi:serine/threonine protein kinase/tetratricopeptide (TPR) repeat protein
MTLSVSRSGAGASADAAFAELVEELTARLQGGGPLDVEAYLEQHPEHAGRLRELLPALQMLAEFSEAASGGAGALAPPPGLTPAGTLGDFRLLREMGRGGMGLVYEAEQISLNRRVALKVLPFAATMDPRQLQRFHNEARAAAGLHHTNIVPVFGVGCERGVHYYAMQFIDGRTLAEFIAEQRPDAAAPAEAAASAATVPPAARATSAAPRDAAYFRRVAEWGIQAAEALDCAHTLGIVHRDVKPANLMVDTGGRLWVTDFGLAQVQSDARLTMTGDLVGTLRYMSPEQALAKRMVIDHRTDVYSLGATLYELLTLQPAFAGTDRQELLRQIAFEEPMPPRRVNKAIPAELEIIVLKAVEKNAQDRYATAKELADDLRHWLEDRPIKARRSSFRRVATKWARRHRTAVTAAAVCLVVTLAVLVVGALWTNARLRDAAERERYQAEQARRERDLAREEQRWAAQAVDDMYSRVAEEWLGPRPQLQPLQREFLEKALSYFQHAAEAWADDPAVRRKLPEMYTRVGAIRTALGQYVPAEEALRKGIAGFEEGATENPGDRAARNGLYAANEHLARLFCATGRYPEAADTYQRMLMLAAKLVADFPDVAEFRGYSWVTRADLAFALESAGQRDDAERMYHEALNELEQLPAELRDSKKIRSQAANTRNNLGQLHFNAYRFDKAEPLFRQTVAEFERLSKESPTDSDERRRWAFTLSNLGAALINLNRLKEARPPLVEAEAALERLAADFPDLPKISSQLATVQFNLASVLGRLGDIAGSEDMSRKAIGILGKLAAQFPEAPEHQRLLGIAQMNYGNVLRRTGRPADAVAPGRDAVQTCEKLVRDHPGNQLFEADLAEALHALGESLALSEKAADCDAAWSRVVALREKFLAADPENAGRQAALASACYNLAFQLAWHQGPPYTGAERAVGLAVRATELEPTIPRRWMVLGVARCRVGSWQASLEAFEQMRKLGGKDTRMPFFAAIAYWHLENKDAARLCYEAGARWLERQTKPDKHDLRIRDEAAALLGIQERAPKQGEERPPAK